MSSEPVFNPIYSSIKVLFGLLLIVVFGGAAYTLSLSLSSPQRDIGIPGSVVVAASIPVTLSSYVPPPKKPSSLTCTVCGGDGIVGDGNNGKPCWKCRAQTNNQNNPKGYAVIFTQNACPPCQPFISTLRSTLETAELRWTFCEVTKGDETCSCHIRICNIDASERNKDYARKLGISVYPSTVVFQNKTEVTRVIGVCSPETLSSIIPK